MDLTFDMCREQKRRSAEAAREILARLAPDADPGKINRAAKLLQPDLIEAATSLTINMGLSHELATLLDEILPPERASSGHGAYPYPSDPRRL